MDQWNDPTQNKERNKEMIRIRRAGNQGTIMESKIAKKLDVIKSQGS